jgi:hypothetical protein
MQNFDKECKVTRVKNAVAAGTTNITDAAIIDMQGFTSVAFLVAFGTLTSTQVSGLKIQQSANSDMSSPDDLTGTALTIPDGDSNKVLVTDLLKPSKRYVRLIITRGTANAVVDGAFAFQYGAKRAPVTHDSTVSSSETNVSPAVGTP